MLVPHGAGFLVILLSRLRQTPQSKDANKFRAFFVRINRLSAGTNKNKNI